MTETLLIPARLFITWHEMPLFTQLATAAVLYAAVTMAILILSHDDQ